MATNTTNYSFIKPAVNDAADQDLWGGYLNTNWDSIDGLLKTATDTTTSTKTTTYTVTTSDRNGLILANATGGAFTISLPTVASAGAGFKISFKKTDASANAVTIDGNGSEEIDGATTYALSEQYDFVTLVNNGTSWDVISDKTNLSFASNSTALAGTATDEALTPANFGTQNDLSSDGYQILPGGLVLQWGSLVIPPESDQSTETVTFPLEFPNNCFGVYDSSGIATRADSHNFAQIVGTPTTTSFEVTNQYVSLGNVAITFRWMALGN